MRDSQICKRCGHRYSRHIGTLCHGGLSGGTCPHGHHKFEPIFAKPLTRQEMTEAALGLVVSLVTEIVDHTPQPERHKRSYRELKALGSRVKDILDHFEGQPTPAFYEASGYILDQWNKMIEESGLAPDDSGV